MIKTSFIALLLIAAIARADQASEAVSASLDADGVQRATLVLDSFSYTPSHLVVTVDRPVELTLVSKSGLTPHNLVLDDAASGLSLRQDVRAGQTVTLSFTPTRAGRFAFFCDKKPPFMASHRDRGMEGVLEVRPVAEP